MSCLLKSRRPYNNSSSATLCRMDWYAALGIFAALLQLVSIIPYVKDMIYGTTRPNIVSWSIWALLVFIGIGAQWSAGASWSILLLAATGFNLTLVAGLGLFGYGYKKYGLLDLVCLGLALFAIGMWFVFSDPVIAILLIIFADFCAGVPTLFKSFKDPHSEMLLSWVMIVVASALSLFSSEKIDIANLAYPAYLLAFNGLVSILIVWGRKSLKG